jgi:hypothetical protein
VTGDLATLTRAPRGQAQCAAGQREPPYDPAVKPRIVVLDGEYVLATLPPQDTPAAIGPSDFAVVIRDPLETTLVLDALAWKRLEREHPSARSEGGYRVLRLDAEFPLTVVGVLARLSATLAAAGIPLMAYSTFKTDLLLVRGADLDRALEALTTVDL